VPFILYQTWKFVAPGLYKHEKRIIIRLFFSTLFRARGSFSTSSLRLRHSNSCSTNIHPIT
jgi:hypothetical protein